MNNENLAYLYGAKWCAFCRMLKMYMDKEEIKYQYLDVDDKLIEQEMLEKTDGKYLIPTVIINGHVYQNPKPQEVKELVNG